MLFAIFNAAGFTSFSPMVCALPYLAIRYTTSHDAVMISLLMGTKSKTGRVAFSSYLALFILNSVSVVFLYFQSPCIFRKFPLVLLVLS